MQMVRPLPMLPLAHILPLCRSIICFVMASPSPLPLRTFVRARSVR